MADQIPTVGRQVHYVSHGSPNGQYVKTCRAATVTEVDAEHQDVVGLAVLNPTGAFFNRTVCQDEANRAGGTWHWPDRV